MDSIDFDEMSDEEAVWAILQSQHHTSKILYPKQVTDFPLPPARWFIVLVDDNDWIDNMDVWGRVVIGLDSLYKATW